MFVDVTMLVQREISLSPEAAEWVRLMLRSNLSREDFDSSVHYLSASELVESAPHMDYILKRQQPRHR